MYRQYIISGIYRQLGDYIYISPIPLPIPTLELPLTPGPAAKRALRCETLAGEGFRWDDAREPLTNLGFPKNASYK